MVFIGGPRQVGGADVTTPMGPDIDTEDPGDEVPHRHGTHEIDQHEPGEAQGSYDHRSVSRTSAW